ncbi:MAG: ABC transporter permease [Chloroflexi bacterium]|nr:ABC transporter permease [Chloroflexota bacterium]
MDLRHIWFIALKDLRRFTTDRLALFFFVLFPFMFIVLFNFLLSGTGGRDERLHLSLVTREAPGGLSYQIIEALETKDDSQLQPGQPKIIWLKDYDAAWQRVADEKLGGFISFPADFTQSVLMGYGTQLEVVVDAGAAETRAALDGLARTIAAEVTARQVTDSAIIALLIEQQLQSTGRVGDIGPAIERLFAGQATPAAPKALVEFKVEHVGDIKAMNPSNYVIPGYLVMFVFFAAALGAETIVRERQNNTLERLLASSVSRNSVLGGIFLGTAFKGLVQIIIFWTVGVLAFKIDLGLAPVAVIILSILMVLMSAAFSVMLATLARSQRAAGSIAVLVSLLLAPLGGSWWPLFITPRWMQSLAKLTPHGWANTGFNRLMVFGGDFASVVPELLALAVFAIGFAIVAMLRFRTKAV